MKIAIVTGASSGIGREFVKIMDKKLPMLDEIWVIARRTDRLEDLQHHIRRPLRIFSMDLSKRDSLYELKQLMDKKKPHIYVLAACAGFGKYGANIKQKLEDTLGMIDVNVSALTGVVQMSLPYMVKGGRMLLAASSAAFLPQPGFGVYAATKSYVLSYARSLNAELHKRKISVTAVCPGPVETEFFHISGTGGSLSIIKKLFIADAKKVAALAWHDAMNGTEVSVYGLSIKTFHTAAKILPHKIFLKGMRLFQ